MALTCVRWPLVGSSADAGLSLSCGAVELPTGITGALSSVCTEETSAGLGKAAQRDLSGGGGCGGGEGGRQRRRRRRRPLRLHRYYSHLYTGLTCIRHDWYLQLRSLITTTWVGRTSHHPTCHQYMSFPHSLASLLAAVFTLYSD